MDKFIKNTVEKIKMQHIVPEARWKFLVRKYGMWALLVIIVFMGAASFATAYHLLSSLDWDLYRFMHVSAFSYALSIIPYVWLVFILLASVIAFIDVRKTQTGYRFSALKISTLTIGGIILFGLGMSILGIGRNINDIAAKKVPYYGSHMMTNKNSQWSQPEKGLIAGTINSVNGDSVILTDLEGKNWKVVFDTDVLIRPVVNIEPQEMVKIIGKKKDNSTFEAREIRPWMGRGMMNGGGRGMMRNR